VYFSSSVLMHRCFLCPICHHCSIRQHENMLRKPKKSREQWKWQLNHTQLLISPVVCIIKKMHRAPCKGSICQDFVSMLTLKRTCSNIYPSLCNTTRWRRRWWLPLMPISCTRTIANGDGEDGDHNLDDYDGDDGFAFAPGVCVLTFVMKYWYECWWFLSIKFDRQIR